MSLFSQQMNRAASPAFLDFRSSQKFALAAKDKEHMIDGLYPSFYWSQYELYLLAYLGELVITYFTLSMV